MSNLKKYLVGIIIGGLLGLWIGVNLGKGVSIWSNPFDDRPISEQAKAVKEKATEKAKEAVKGTEDKAKKLLKDAKSTLREKLKDEEDEKIPESRQGN
jgi:hypothetical protein